MAQNVKDTDRKCISYGWNIDKCSLGFSSLSLIKLIFDDYGTQSVAQFIDECQFLANKYMLYTVY